MSLVLSCMGGSRVVLSENSVTRRVPPYFGPPEGAVAAVAGTGEAGYGGDGSLSEYAVVNFPQDIEVDLQGRIYFADTDNHRVRCIDPSSGVIETVAGTGDRGYGGDGGMAGDSIFNRPFGIAFDSKGVLYISDTFNGRIRRVLLP